MKSTTLLLSVVIFLLVPPCFTQAASRTVDISQTTESQSVTYSGHFQKKKKKRRFGERLRKAFSLKRFFKPNSQARKAPIWGIISFVLAALCIALTFALLELSFFLGLIISTALAVISLGEGEMRGPAIASLVLSVGVLVLMISLIISCRRGDCL